MTEPTWRPVWLALAALSLVLVTCRSGAQAFTNPVFQSQDPWVTYVDGSYYYSDSAGRSIRIRKSPTLTGLATATPIVVWRAPDRGPNSQNVWSPEIHCIGAAWYIYYAADDGDNAHHRIFVVQATSSDPQGSYREGDTGYPAGEIHEANNCWAIDPDVFTAADGKRYLVWSGWPTGSNMQCIYLAPMADPLHLAGPRVQIARPEQTWETRTAPIEEGPIGYTHNGVTYVVYSGSASWTIDYSVGLLTNPSGQILNSQAWTKSGPILDHHGRSYGPGSVVFTPSPDGTETWMLYHGIDSPKCRPSYACRDIRMQRIAWNPDGSPLLGYPIDPGIPIPVPSGEDKQAARASTKAPKTDTTANSYGWGDAFGDAAEGVDDHGRRTAGWTITSASAVTQRAPGMDRQQIFRGNPDLESYAVSVQARQLESSAASQQPKYGLYAAYADAANYVQVYIESHHGILATHGVVEGKDLGVQTAPLPEGFHPASYHTIRTEKSGSKFRFYLDDVLLQERTFDLLNGQPGLLTEDCQAAFRQFSVTQR